MWRYWALARSSPIIAESSCDLLLPGVLWLRSFFGYQSSFFGWHSARPPHPWLWMCVDVWATIGLLNGQERQASYGCREVDEGNWKEMWGKVGKGNQLCVLQQVFCTCTPDLYWHILCFFSFFEFFLHPLILKTQEAKSVNVVAEEIGEPVRFTPDIGTQIWLKLQKYQFGKETSGVVRYPAMLENPGYRLHETWQFATSLAAIDTAIQNQKGRVHGIFACFCPNSS